MIRIIQGPPDLNFALDVSRELIRLRVTWRDPETRKAEKCVTAAAVGSPQQNERWLMNAVERMAAHVQQASSTTTVVEA